MAGGHEDRRRPDPVLEASLDGTREGPVHRDQVHGHPREARRRRLEHERPRRDRVEVARVGLEPERVGMPTQEVGEQEAALDAAVPGERRAVGDAEGAGGRPRPERGRGGGPRGREGERGEECQGERVAPHLAAHRSVTSAVSSALGSPLDLRDRSTSQHRRRSAASRAAPPHAASASTTPGGSLSIRAIWSTG